MKKLHRIIKKMKRRKQREGFSAYLTEEEEKAVAVAGLQPSCTLRYLCVSPLLLFFLCAVFPASSISLFPIGNNYVLHPNSFHMQQKASFKFQILFFWVIKEFSHPNSRNQLLLFASSNFLLFSRFLFLSEDCCKV